MCQVPNLVSVQSTYTATLYQGEPQSASGLTGKQRRWRAKKLKEAGRIAPQLLVDRVNLQASATVPADNSLGTSKEILVMTQVRYDAVDHETALKG